MTSESLSEPMQMVKLDLECLERDDGPCAVNALVALANNGIQPDALTARRLRHSPSALKYLKTGDDGLKVVEGIKRVLLTRFYCSAEGDVRVRPVLALHQRTESQSKSRTQRI